MLGHHFPFWAQNHLIHLFISAWLRCKMINQMKAHPLHHRSGWAAHCSRTHIQTRAHTTVGGFLQSSKQGSPHLCPQGHQEARPVTESQQRRRQEVGSETSLPATPAWESLRQRMLSPLNPHTQWVAYASCRLPSGHSPGRCS